LLEVLLVLCLLVAFTAMAWPALGRPWASQRLHSAADEVRAEWSRARVRAMSSGQTVVFRYTPEGRRYQTQPRETAGAAFDPIASQEFEELATEFEANAAFPCDRHELPDGMMFLGSEVGIDERSAAAAENLAEPVEGNTWSEPIFFYPDGTCSTARLLLANQYDDCVEIALRGLTGVSSVGQLQSLEAPLP
jgi:hypothetical protein